MTILEGIKKDVKLYDHDRSSFEIHDLANSYKAGAEFMLNEILNDKILNLSGDLRHYLITQYKSQLNSIPKLTSSNYINIINE